jgi:hypothetical protein
MKKIISLIILTFFLTSIYSQKNAEDSLRIDSVILVKFFHDLTSRKFDKDKIYSKYFYKTQSGKPGRSENEIRFYKDTLFRELHDSLKNTGVLVYPLKTAKRIFKEKVDYNFYYDSQEDHIYYVLTNDKRQLCVLYALVVYNKIISLYGIAEDKEFIGWR